jgi:hypothetical protein
MTLGNHTIDRHSGLGRKLARWLRGLVRDLGRGLADVFEGPVVVGRLITGVVEARTLNSNGDPNGTRC